MNPYHAKAVYDQGIDAKVVVMGNTGVGKTSLLHRYTQNKFEPKNTTSTTGAFFVTKKVQVDGVKVRLQLWDTAGQERFRSMAPMYYRGANAALLLYDITNSSTFEAVRGWLQELKKNCSPDLIIYIVGSKADLYMHRQVTQDLARLSLHNWFPPPRPPSPPVPISPPSTFSYIRPRFTSFTSVRSSSPAAPPPPTSSHSSPDRPSSMDRVGLRRSNTSANGAAPRVPRPQAGLLRANTTATAARSNPSFLGAKPGYENETSSNSIPEDEDEPTQEWGLHKGMELFEVSAKDATGIQNLFQSLITAILKRKDAIERENELKKRDSVLLSSATMPDWAAQADEEEAREKAEAAARSGWSCCSS